MNKHIADIHRSSTNIRKGRSSMKNKNKIIVLAFWLYSQLYPFRSMEADSFLVRM
jgi:hypothetical protein